jgi:CBS domain-containing protein
VGIVSDRDILLHSRRSDDGDIEVSPLTIEDVMTKHVRTCSPEDSISEIADTMIGFKIDSVPVVDEGELIGLVTSTDLLELLREREASGIARKLPFNYDIKVYRGGAAL